MTNEVTLMSFDEVREALASQDLTRSLDMDRDERGNILERSLLVLEGQDHRIRRRAENSLFRPERLLLYEEGLFPEVVARTLDGLDDDGRADLMDIGALLSVVLSARTVGIDLDLDDLQRRRRLIELRQILSRGIAIDAYTGDVDALKLEVRQALRALQDEFIAPAITRRRQRRKDAHDDAPGSPEANQDLLTVLLEHAEELDMDEDAIVRECGFFLDAGSDTSTQALTSVMHYLFEWSVDHPEDAGQVAADRLWAQRCVHEALRIRPTNPRIMRRALRDTTIAGHAISAGSLVRLDTLSANRDPRVYGPDANDFNPNRSVPPTQPRFGHTFSGGVHQCLGRTLAVGFPLRADEARSDHQYGLVTLMVQGVAARGIRPDPERPARLETGTTRTTRWASYPILLESPGAANRDPITSASRPPEVRR